MPVAPTNGRPVSASSYPGPSPTITPSGARGISSRTARCAGYPFTANGHPAQFAQAGLACRVLPSLGRGIGDDSRAVWTATATPEIQRLLCDLRQQQSNHAVYPSWIGYDEHRRTGRYSDCLAGIAVNEQPQTRGVGNSLVLGDDGCVD